MQIDPEAEIPVDPPEGEFLGDGIRLSAAPVPGGVLFLASGANSGGVVTELMVQKLPNVRRKPGKQYKSMAFPHFASGSLEYVLPLPPGVYALAYRFVEASTGRVAETRRAGVVTVT